MNFFGDNPLGPWDHKFTFTNELGCGSTFIGFILFLVAVIILSKVLF